MSEVATRFCMQCGAPVAPGSGFCMQCGAHVLGPDAPVAGALGTGSPDAAAGVVAQPVPSNSAGSALQGAAAAYGQVARYGGLAMGAGGLATALPWHTVAGHPQPLDISRLISSGTPAAQAAVRATVRRPAIALLVTSVLDLGVALLSGQPAALRLVGVRFAMAAITAVLGIAASRKTGGKAGASPAATGARSGLRKATGVFSIATGVVQLGSMLWTSVSGIAHPASLLMLVPSIISQVSALVMSVKTAIVGLKS